MTTEFEQRARALVMERMRLYGYTEDQVDEAAMQVDHYDAGCIWLGQDWDCSSDRGESNHPDSDEYDRTAEFVVWVLERTSSIPSEEPADDRPECNDRCYRLPQPRRRTAMVETAAATTQAEAGHLKTSLVPRAETPPQPNPKDPT